MQIINDIDKVQLNNTIITLGKFDGNHVGHRLLFETAVGLKTGDRKTVIFTFSIHPSRVLSEERSREEKDAVRTIQTDEERDEDLYPEGIDYLIRFPFTKKTMSMEPEEFVEQILVRKLGVRDIVCGTDFRFGKDRKGDPQLLEKLGQRYGFDVHILKKVEVRLEGEDAPVEVSSTLIKQEIMEGHMENVRLMMGKPFSVTGTILHGKHFGSTMGFPTINQEVPDDKILPPDGVYATRTTIGGKTWMSITNVGVRPTFDDGVHRTVETNLFDFDQDVYGEEASVAFYHFIRPERKFEDPAELTAEIEANKREVVTFFETFQDSDCMQG